ncbi:mRNA-decapping enzyme subunit 2 [Amphichorda felina]
MIGNQMELSDWLDDLCVRFIINLPEEDLSSVARICFQVEEAQWFYEDFIRPLDPNLPSMTLRTFCLRLFQHCPLLATFSVENHTRAFEEFLQYKTRVPVRGAILLNHEMDSTVLVKGWKKGASWSFPRGKINKDEDDLDCAVREVWEETGLDLRAAGLVPTESNPKFIEITMREQQMRLYIFRDVPMETKFQPQTRKEISKIQWYKLSELPAFRKKGGQNNGTNNGPDASASASKFYMVAPFLVPLKKWVLSQKKIATRQTSMTVNQNNFNPHFSVDEAPTEDDAWPQVVPSVTAPAPELDTLEGATHELQRLLKVQPPTQGSAMQEDKAIALLSMLKLGGASRPGHPIPS